MGNQGTELSPSITCDPSKLAVLVPARWGSGPFSLSCPSWVSQATLPIAWHAPCHHPNAPETFFIITSQWTPRGQGGCVGHPSLSPT